MKFFSKSPKKVPLAPPFQSIDDTKKWVSQQLKTIQEDVHIVNHTTDIIMFEQALTEIKTLLSSLIPYETQISFVSTKPSDDLKIILKNESLYRRRCQKRIFDKKQLTSTPSTNTNNFFTEQRTHCPKTDTYYPFDHMDGHAFEAFCADLLKQNGYYHVSITGASGGDQGIDIIAYGQNDISYAIQCKCYHANVGNKAVQEAFAGCQFYRCRIPVVLTNSRFTESAQQLARETGVLLWDRTKLLSFYSTTL